MALGKYELKITLRRLRINMCSVLVSIHCLTKWLLINSFVVMAHMQILMTASSLAWGTVERAKYAIARENLPLARLYLGYPRGEARRGGRKEISSL